MMPKILSQNKKREKGFSRFGQRGVIIQM